MSTTSSSDLSFDYINSTLNKSIQSTGDELKTTISSLGENPTTMDLLTVQQEVANWTLMTQIQSTIVKEMSDAAKGVIQKAG